MKQMVKTRRNQLNLASPNPAHVFEVVIRDEYKQYTRGIQKIVKFFNFLLISIYNKFIFQHNLRQG